MIGSFGQLVWVGENMNRFAYFGGSNWNLAKEGQGVIFVDLPLED